MRNVDISTRELESSIVASYFVLMHMASDVHALVPV